MAEKLDTYTFRTNPRRSYDWDLWLNGDIWKLTQGEDFTSQMSSFRAYIYAVAKRRSLTVHVSDKGNHLVVQAQKEKS